MAGLGRRHPALLALAAALVLGCAGRVLLRSGVSVPHGAELGAVARAALALGGPWLACAWAIGAVTASWRVAAVALALGVAAWYALTVAGSGGRAVAYAVPVGVAWSVVALGAGAAFGFAGARRNAAVLAGALAGEALLLAGEWTGRAAQAVLSAELAVAGAVLVVLGRRRWWIALPVAIVFALAEGSVRDTLRLAG